MHYLWDTTTWKYVALIWPFTALQCQCQFAWGQYIFENNQAVDSPVDMFMEE